MGKVERPRVAAIGLTAEEAEVLRKYAGTVFEAETPNAYIFGEAPRSWAETDIVVGRLEPRDTVPPVIDEDVHVLLVAGDDFFLRPGAHRSTALVWSSETSMYEWEAKRGACAGKYNRALGHATSPSLTPLSCWRVDEDLIDEHEVLASASDQSAVALRYIRRFTKRGLSKATDGTQIERLPKEYSVSAHGIGVGMPSGGDLRYWYPAFLRDVHSRNKESVPQAPSERPIASEWATAEEAALMDKIEILRAEASLLEEQVETMASELAESWETGNHTDRACLFTDDTELVQSVIEIFETFGFTVTNVDEQVEDGDPKREDLHIETPEVEGVGLVEVTGSQKGVATSKSRQINEHVKSLCTVSGKPFVILWVVNHNINTPLEDRPSIKNSEIQAAETIDAVLVDTRDLYRCWQKVIQGELSREDARRSISDAQPGLWVPPSN